MIHVCFGLHDKTGRYSKFVGTAMLSIFDNVHTPPQLPSVTVHILHDSTLTQDNREKFIQLTKRYNQLVMFYNVTEICEEKLKEMLSLVPKLEKSRVSVGAFYKLLIPQVLPKEIEKVIYLDSDIIVNLDIHKLWQIELGDSLLGVVPKKTQYANSKMATRRMNKAYALCRGNIVKIDDYFNSGVLIMNLNLLRNEEQNIMRGIKFRGENPKQVYWDQTVLNYCFSERTVKMSRDFNRNINHARRHKENPSGKICHYNLNVLGLNIDDAFDRLWMSNFIRTPFFDEEAIGRLCTEFLQVRDNLEDMMAKTSAIVSGKTRAFFVKPAKIESLKNFFSIRDDELIIPAESKESLQKLIDAMKSSVGKCVFFIMTEKFLKKDFPFEMLIKEGFVLDKDFVKGWQYLSGDYGNPLNSHPFVQAM